MNLIDRYIVEVGKHLPRKNRADIEAEIRSTLEDMLDERMQGKGPAEEALVMEVLKEYGSPREVASKYQTHQHQYLIGPRMYPIFEFVLRIVFAVVIGVSFIGLGVALSKDIFAGQAIVSSMGEWFTGLIGGLIAAFGNVVLVFAILERTPIAHKYDKDFNEWDPEELKSEPDPDKIDLADHIATLIFTVLGLVLLNLYPNLLAIRFSNDGTWVSIPILTDTFFRYLPWINVMGLLQIAFHAFMLGQRDWKPLTRILGIVMDIAGMVLGVVILRTPGIFDITSKSLSALGMGEDVNEILNLFSYLPTLIITIIAIVTTIKVVQTLIRLFAVRSKLPYLKIK